MKQINADKSQKNFKRRGRKERKEHGVAIAKRERFFGIGSQNSRCSKSYKQRKEFLELVHSGLKENHGAHTDYIRINIMLKKFYRKGRREEQRSQRELRK